ncbi:MAG: class I SAM-dependent methyltransferase [Microbacterium sp.]
MTDAEIGAAYDARAAEYIALASGMAVADVALITGWRDATPGRLLDAGCGPGQWTGLLHDGHRDAQGVDLSAEFIAAARRRHPCLAFEIASFRRLPFPDASFGGVLAWYSLIHTPPADLPEVLRELARVLTPGGGLLIGFFDGEAGEPFPHAVTTAYFWRADVLASPLEDAGFALTATESRPRLPGEVSSRPHASVTAVRSRGGVR